MQKYLEVNTYIDWKHPEILAKAKELSLEDTDTIAITKSCFGFVRDQIKHSGDYKIDTVTCKASDVLKHETGWCYAKSHLLAALLRANNIPAGLCYQRLTIDNNEPPFCLHGLNAVYLKKHGWYRIDARGNKPGVDARFCPPLEKLAFQIISEGEITLPEIWNEPLPMVIHELETRKTYLEVVNNLPDIEVL